jgi:PilZ domain
MSTLRARAADSVQRISSPPQTLNSLAIVPALPRRRKSLSASDAKNETIGHLWCLPSTPSIRPVIAAAEKFGSLLEGTQFRRRVESRNRMKLNVVFRWKDADGAHEAEGITRDLSPKGIYVNTAFPPAIHGVVRCYMLLPSLTDDETETGDLEATVIGRVVRTDSSDHCGFAVAARVFVLARV